MTPDLRFDLLREIPEDLSLRRQWNALVKRVHRPQVFYTYEWSLAVQRAYRAALRPLIFLAYDERDSLCGVVALASNPEGNRVSFLCATTADYCDFLSSPEQKPALVKGVMAELRRQGIGDITLTNLPADSDTVSILRRAVAEQGYHCFARKAYLCAQISLENLERRPGEKTPVLARKKMVRRFMNAMGRDVPVRLDHARSWEDIEPVLPQFMQAHVARFLFTGRISNMAHPERRMFLEELAKLLSEAGCVTLTRMVSGTNAFAWNYGFQFEDTWFWYQPSFDSDLGKYSPGFCLLAKIVEEAVDTPGLKIVDLGLGAEEYKDRFANRTRETLCVMLRASAGQHVREILHYRTAQLLRVSPRVEAAVRLIARSWSRLRRARGGTTETLSHIRRRLATFLWSETEVLFLEWCGSAGTERVSLKLEPLDWNRLATATCQYIHDAETLAYLLRAASHLRNRVAQGFGLVGPDGTFLHFAWVTEFDRFFLAELNTRLVAPSPECVLLFDHWTPAAARGHGYDVQAAGLIARLMQETAKKPWIFLTAAGNVSWRRGLEKTGFETRYSLTRQQALGSQRIRATIPRTDGAKAAGVSARV